MFGMTAPEAAIPILCVSEPDYPEWYDNQPSSTQYWLDAQDSRNFKAGKALLLPEANGASLSVLCIVPKEPTLWDISHLPTTLPQGSYVLEEVPEDAPVSDWVLGWMLGSYRFTEFKTAESDPPLLCWPDDIDQEWLETTASAICLVRDLINLPPNHLLPSQLQRKAEELANGFDADCDTIVGESLLSENFPGIHMVGRASADAPRLIDLRWGDTSNPQVTLVGKGVCFDSGGLDIKPSSGMKLMKKDMGGAAHALGLASMIMGANLPISLRVLIPAVENAISGNAFRTSDVIRTRKGLTIEVGNTDAEGRVILCDALAEADSESPDLIIDFATLTGAARIALGTELPALFCNDDEAAHSLQQTSMSVNDPLWRLPLWKDYKQQLSSDVADTNTIGDPFGGAITAALFLEQFVEQTPTWVHIDVMAWNSRTRPGRPKGGEAMGIRALFHWLEQRYGVSS